MEWSKVVKKVPIRKPDANSRSVQNLEAQDAFYARVDPSNIIHKTTTKKVLFRIHCICVV